MCFSPRSQKELPDRTFRLVLLLDEGLTVLVHYAHVMVCGEWRLNSGFVSAEIFLCLE